MSQRRTRPSDARGDEERALLAELTALYQEVDQRTAEHGCDDSSECCRFAITGREPYVTSIELALLLRAFRARGGRVERLTKASLPLAPDGRCPLLTEAARGAVYAARPFGCRTFFCERATAPRPLTQQEINSWVARLKQLGERHEAGGGAGRPLTRGLMLNKS